MYIANNIKYLRRSQGMTQRDLARQLNKHTVSVSDYEMSKSTPPIDVALQLCDIFGVDLDTLVTRDLAMEEVTPLEVKDRTANYNTKSSITEKYLKQQYNLLQRLCNLQDKRLAELEREIREHAPELAKRLGLGE